MVTNMWINGMHSVMVRNLRLMESRLAWKNIMCVKWAQKCGNKRDLDRLCEMGVSAVSLKKGE